MKKSAAALYPALCVVSPVARTGPLAPM